MGCSMPSENVYVEVLIPVSQCVTSFGIRAFADGIG